MIGQPKSNPKQRTLLSLLIHIKKDGPKGTVFFDVNSLLYYH